MAVVSRLIKRIIWLLAVAAVGFILFEYYSVIFAKTVIGRIENVARVTEVTAILGSRPIPDNQIYSFSVSIKQPNGELLTATSEDRQWAVAKSGLCAKAKFFPYPPWDFNKAGTYFNARLMHLVECTSEAAKEIGIESSHYTDSPNPAASPVASPEPNSKASQ